MNENARLVEQQGTASTRMAIFLMVKASLGTGVLAVPSAFAQSGVVASIALLTGLAWFNDWCGLRLLRCCELLKAKRAESPLAAVGRAAYGPAFATVVETTFLGLVLGVVTSYLVACHDVVAVAFGLTGRNDVYVAATLMFPLTLVEDVGRLAPVSIVALVCLCVAFVAIVCFAASSEPQGITWGVYPGALASGFGVFSYCYGLVPLVPQFEASMRRPRDFKFVQRVSLAITALVYVVVGLGVALLYDGDCKGNILDNLPPRNRLANLVRVLMALVCIASSPVGIVAAASVLETKFGLAVRIPARVLYLACAAAIAANVPSFALVVAVVGAGAVSFLSFVLPPLVHLRLGLRQRRRGSLLATTRLLSPQTRRHGDEEEDPTSSSSSSSDAPRVFPAGGLVMDAILVAFGLVVVVVATALTADSVWADIRRLHAATRATEEEDTRQRS